MRPHPVYHALEGALEASVPRLDLEGETLILVDVSGSMYQRMSRKGESTYALAAATLGAVLYRQAGGRLFGFSDDLIPVPFSPGDPLVAMVETPLDLRRVRYLPGEGPGQGPQEF
ncbi:hypothetical protein [Thermus parvatiensis]|nr:hypothetical protein [Thermus parvatiensis]